MTVIPAAEVVRGLRERGWTIAVAESLTGGALCAALVSVPGASEVLRGGVVAYATPIKHSVLGVDAALLAREGAVHPEVARQMARGVRTALQVSDEEASVGVATTGIAGPDSPDGQPVGTVHIGVSTPERTLTRAFLFEGDRETVRAQSVDAALRLLAECLGE
ncbi:CinA family protein [uncultured Microbacterium sp.]|uniref:CinA family protein n=1 Tax=uncultured Microbacterium sp. TaxID=191216 RepID=UPI0028DC65DF|nr:CinA family protein [uncultured Microbacterium sp.]